MVYNKAQANYEKLFRLFVDRRTASRPKGHLFVTSCFLECFVWIVCYAQSPPSFLCFVLTASLRFMRTLVWLRILRVVISRTLN